MDIALWIAQILLAVAFLGAGMVKLTQPRPALADKGMGFAEDVSDTGLKAIGAVEVLAAIGLVAPAATGIATVLTPLAAAGLVVTMLGAMVVHARRDEYSDITKNVVLALLAAVVAWARFGPHAF